MKGKTILLVDDEEAILRSLSLHLTDNGFDVLTAASGKEAILRLKEKHYDLVLTDLRMQGLNGIDVLREAKILDPEICVIILTAYGDMLSAIEALRLGADDYMLKPCELDELILRISNCLDKQHLARKIKIYENILPICSCCKKIRDDSGKEPGAGDWIAPDLYLRNKAHINVSHGWCPECLKKALKDADNS